MNLKYFKYEVSRNILLVFFDNSEYSNAFGMNQALEFEKLYKYALKKNLKGFLLTSESPIFCSGGHLKDYAQKSKLDGLKINKKITEILNGFQKIPIPTLCLIQGDCFGGGLEWITSFDKIYSTPQSFFGMWQRKLSLSWGWGGGNRLKMRLSKKQLMQQLLEAKTQDAFTAKKLNLIDDVFPKSVIFLKAYDYFEHQASLPKNTLTVLKKEDLLKMNSKKEAKLFQKLWWNEEHLKVLSKYK